MKKTLAILLAVLMMLTLFACTKKADNSDKTEPTKAPVDPKVALKEAAEKMQLLNSEHIDMTCDVFIVMRFYGTEQNMDVNYDISIDTQKEPSVAKMEGTIRAMGNTADYLYYGVQEGDNVQTYVSTDKGQTWTTGSSDVAGLADQANSLNTWLLEAEPMEVVDPDPAFDVDATVYSCQIPGSTFAQSNDMLSSLGGGIDASLLEDIAPVPATVWIDNETGMILRIKVDMSEYMRTILDRAMESQMAGAGMNIDVEVDVQRAYMDAKMSQFDSVPPIVVPEEAKTAGSTVVSGDGIVGTWELFDGEGEESQQTVQMLLSFGMTMEMTFNEDGTGTMATSFSGETETEEFTYTIEGDQILIDGEPAAYRIEDGLLHISIDTDVLIFRRK